MPAFINEEQWTIDGVPLSTWAYNIESIGGRHGIPPMMGNNVSVPFRRGELWRAKLPAARTLSLGMWIRSSDANGITPSTAVGRRAQFNENLRALKQLFYNTERELVLVKNIRYLNGMQAYTAKAECISTLDPTMVGPNFGKMVVDLKMSDPYWTTGPISKVISSAAGMNATNPGDDVTTKIFIEFKNLFGQIPATSFVFTNTTAGVSVSIPGPQPGTFWTMDVENFVFTRSGDMTVNYQSLVGRSGSAYWMELKKGINNFTTSGFGSTGVPLSLQITMTFYPVYL